MTTTLKHSANLDILTNVIQTHSHSVLLSDDYSNFVPYTHLCHSKICFPKAFLGTSESGKDANPDSLMASNSGLCSPKTNESIIFFLSEDAF